MTVGFLHVLVMVCVGVCAIGWARAAGAGGHGPAGRAGGRAAGGDTAYSVF